MASSFSTTVSFYIFGVACLSAWNFFITPQSYWNAKLASHNSTSNSTGLNPYQQFWDSSLSGKKLFPYQKCVFAWSTQYGAVYAMDRSLKKCFTHFSCDLWGAIYILLCWNCTCELFQQKMQVHILLHKERLHPFRLLEPNFDDNQFTILLRLFEFEL